MVPPRPARLTVPPVMPTAVTETEPILSPTPQLVVRSVRAPSNMARMRVYFTGKILREVQLECCQLLIFQAREMCGYFANECARPMVTTRAGLRLIALSRRRSRSRADRMDTG